MSENLSLLNLTLRTFFSLFVTLRRHLKLQMELFFHALINILDAKSDSFLYQETVLESLLSLLHDPIFLLELVADFDFDYKGNNVWQF